MLGNVCVAACVAAQRCDLAVFGNLLSVVARMPSRRIDWYAPPQQIRQWGDPEPEHNDDHFHMFYDLAFVAGAYVA